MDYFLLAENTNKSIKHKSVCVCVLFFFMVQVTEVTGVQILCNLIRVNTEGEFRHDRKTWRH